MAMATDSPQRDDLLAQLAQTRRFFRFTVQGLTEEQATDRPTASELCLGGLIKHVASVEANWIAFTERGAEAMESTWNTEAAQQAWATRFTMGPGETLEGHLAEYERVAERTTEVVEKMASLDDAHPLPNAPWFEAGATWTNRRVLLHIIAETAQHAGHADILRETIDGQKSMG
jgi:uncharacterized damage-inducible protein DinB